MTEKSKLAQVSAVLETQSSANFGEKWCVRASLPGIKFLAGFHWSARNKPAFALRTTHVTLRGVLVKDFRLYPGVNDNSLISKLLTLNKDLLLRETSIGASTTKSL